MKSFLKKHRIGTAVAIGILIVVVLSIRSSRNKKNLDTAIIKRGDIVEAAYAVGTVKADKTFNIKTGVASKLLERYVRVGDIVKKGQKLLHLDEFPEYRAPFDGVVTALNYEVGELVFAQTIVLTVVNMDSLYLELSMDERVVGSIRPGQEARISFEGQRNSARTGKVRSIYASDGQFLVLVDFDTKGLSILPGMTCDVAIQIEKHKNKLLLPLGAIDANGQITIVRPHGKPEKISVELGPSDASFTIISNDLVKDGDIVEIPKDAPKKR